MSTVSVQLSAIPVSEIAIANLRLRPAGCELFVDGRRLHLTVREFQLLEAFIAAEGAVVSQDELSEAVWERPRAGPRDRLVDAFVRKLRGKLAAATPDWSYIRTYPGQGYRFEPRPHEEGQS